MYKEVLQAIPDIETYPIIALIVFFTFFSALMVWFFTADKNRLEQDSRLPLDEADHKHVHQQLK